MISSPTRDRIIADAQNAASLLAAAETQDPMLAQFLQGKSLIGSKTMWYPLVSWGVVTGSAYFGMGLDASTAMAIASGISYMIMLAVRLITSTPIDTLLPAKKSA